MGVDKALDRIARRTDLLTQTRSLAGRTFGRGRTRRRLRVGRGQRIQWIVQGGLPSMT
jgi:hypothetical protein